ncbi:CoA transferase [Spirillospora sp. NPDC047418]|jgi:crotonobetainyl-CoA:carnitine CoA-transferase CaiB-like acyl-CoA transferase
MTSALEGVRVLDFGRVLAAPYATMLLADLGAEVLKIESPQGDDTRHWGPPWRDGESTYFRAVNRNKVSVVLDLRDADDAARARDLVRTSDVLVENFRPGTMDRHGLGYDAARKLNPGIVYCSITGFGTKGGRQLPGYDLLIQATSGLMSITGEAAAPTKVGVALIDVVTGLHATIGILAALRHRSRTGEGQRVEANLLSSALSALTNQASAYVEGGITPTATGNDHPSIVPYGVFETSDGAMVLAVGNDRQFSSLMQILGRPDLAEDPRYATNAKRVENRQDLVKLLNRLLTTAPKAVWITKLSNAGVPAGQVNSIAEAFELAECLGLAPVLDLISGETRSRQVANPIGLSRTPPRYVSPPPAFMAGRRPTPPAGSCSSDCARPQVNGHH